MTESADQTEAMARGEIDRVDGDRGLVLGGRYELTERIASGGMAAVWRAYDDVLARTVAVKLLHGHLAADEAFRERFRREAIAAAKLTHPHVVSLYDTGADGDHVYLVMEYVDGATLREVIADLGSMEPGQAAAVGEKIARALDYAHERGLVHRDVKPANILLGDDGAVKVADFGIAKAEEHDGDLTKTGMVLGTAAYVAPEQITGAEPVDGRADQYALGCMLYEALTGKQPFKGETAVATAAQRLESSPAPLRSLRPDIPRGLDTIVMRAMARNPADRFVSLGAMAEALAAFADPDASHTAALPLATSHRATSLGRGGGAPAQQRVAVSPPEPAAGESFLRTEGRWLLPVIVLFVVAGGLIAAGVSSGMFDASRLPGVGDQDDESGDGGAPDDVEPLDIAEAVAFDPQGDGGESDGQLSNLLDGDDTTTWRTEIYNTAEFGGLKDGVGFYVDLGDPHQITGVELQLADSGLNFDVRVAEEAESDAADWEPVGSPARDASGVVEIGTDDPVTGRYVLVWVTAPLPDDGGYKAEFAGITVLGATGDDGS